MPTPSHSTQRGAGRFTVDLGLDVLPAEGRRRRGGAVDAEAVLGQVAAVGGDEPARAGLGAQHLGHGGDGVHDVVVPRAAGERQSAGDGERSAGSPPAGPVRRPPPEPPTGSRSRGRRGRGRRRRCPPVSSARRPPIRMAGERCNSSRSPMQIGVVGVGPGVGENPTVAGDLQMLRLLRRAEDQRRGLIHHVVGVHQLGVGPADHPVVRAGRRDLLGRQRHRGPRRADWLRRPH